MSKVVDDKALETYYSTLQTLKTQQGVEREGSTRRAFAALLTDIAKPRKLTLVEEDAQKAAGRTIYYDGVLRDEWRLPHARWEAKDTHDDLDKEIKAKRDKGYQFDNIIFEDTETAVLFQAGTEVMRAPIADRTKFAYLLERYITFDIAPFRDVAEALEFFKAEIPHIAGGLKERIDEAHAANKGFQAAFLEFFELCKRSLNPNISQAAVDEMLIQHMLTERLIRKIFDEYFLQRNVIAGQVQKIILKLASGSFDYREFLGGLERFYVAIERAADSLTTNTEKLYFLNTIYERFFQGYSVKVADTHGIVYTPQPIVDFMCAAVEEVLKDEFGVQLGGEGVIVLDPAVGTGSFIVNLLGRVNERNLHDFFAHRLFANEVLLMPYYLASLNIEMAYYERTGRHEAFEGMCYVDTLDLHAGRGQLSLFSEENTARVQRQQDSAVTVVIGNPPYNVGQLNENDNNKNREYKTVDDRIRQTYIQDSTATNNNMVYDMYVRFFRWAVDRLGDRDGVVCFVTNNGFVDGIAFDGMRRHLLQDFTSIYHLDLSGNARTSGDRRRREGGNVFDDAIRVGVGITVAVRSQHHAERKVRYFRIPDYWKKEQKLGFLAHHVELQGRQNSLNTIEWQQLQPDRKHTWLVSEHADEWETFAPIGTKAGKRAKNQVESIFRMFSNGVKTNRDDTVYNFGHSQLTERVQSTIQHYNAEIDRYKRSGQPSKIDSFVSYDVIKWSRDLKNDLKRGNYAEFSNEKVYDSIYRPYGKRYLFFDRILNEEVYSLASIFPVVDTENQVVCVSGLGSNKPFQALVTTQLPCFDLLEKTQCFPFYVYDEDGGNRQENITDWALAQFQAQYNDPTISKWDIFYYVYGVLHQPTYRAKFADNLKRELPRIPYAPDFWAFSRIGKGLADLHLNYEEGPRHPLDWQTTKSPTSYLVKKMKRKDDSIIYNDTLTLAGIPPQAWDYKLGNRSALDWIIDQYQVKTDKRSGITSDPNQYSPDEQYIVKLIERVTHVSVETVRLVGELPELE